MKFEVETDQKMIIFSKKKNNYIWYKNINFPALKIINNTD